MRDAVNYNKEKLEYAIKFWENRVDEIVSDMELNNITSEYISQLNACSVKLHLKRKQLAMLNSKSAKLNHTVIDSKYITKHNQAAIKCNYY